ncbi:hypothetical protein HBB16_04340 [Pseudonocardia sp. MCCB 268]|nr:hypothetical protein [Pseudonocardia cytotoxica]
MKASGPSKTQRCRLTRPCSSAARPAARRRSRPRRGCRANRRSAPAVRRFRYHSRSSSPAMALVAYQRPRIAGARSRRAGEHLARVAQLSQGRPSDIEHPDAGRAGVTVLSVPDGDQWRRRGGRGVLLAARSPRWLAVVLA